MKQRDGIGAYHLDSLTIYDYYPFGMLKPGRYRENPGYRYGFNGMEKDDDIKGTGNSYTTEFRMNDPRLGRWWSLDPKPTASVNWYASMNNNPIKFNDVLGDVVADKLKEKLNDTRTEYDDFEKAKQQDLNNYINNGGTDKKIIHEKNVELMNVRAERQELENEISALEKSDVIYDLGRTESKDVYSFTPRGSEPRKRAGRIYGKKDEATGQITVYMDYNIMRPEAKRHELRHMYQFEMGEISLSEDGYHMGELGDIFDEIDAVTSTSIYGVDTNPATIRKDYKSLEIDRPGTFIPRVGNVNTTINNYGIPGMKTKKERTNYLNKKKDIFHVP